MVIMSKRCGVHGRFDVLLARDARFYHHALGARDEGGGCCGGSACSASVGAAASAGDADPFEVLSTCIALIEIVDSCNLACPTCYAGSPVGIGDEVDAISIDDYRRRIGGVLARKGFIDIIQLSGGEPTIHPQFFELLDWTLEQKDIGYILINTNGVRVAHDDEFREALGVRRRAGARFELYVQFDGPQPDGQRELRSADLRETRRRAVDDAGAIGIPSTLAMTITPTTLPFLGDTLRWGIARRHVRGITFQPMFTSGRIPDVDTALPMSTPTPISVGDVILSLVEQASELVSVEDFTPLPCGDPNCHTIGYLLRTEAGVTGLSQWIDVPAMQGFLNNRVDYNLETLRACGCETEPLGEVLKQLELSPEQPFRMFIKPFMDAWTFDQDRIDRCCTHVVRQDGSLDSFCRYYLEGGATGGATGGANGGGRR
jgi:hypothetical protein